MRSKLLSFIIQFLRGVKQKPDILFSRLRYKKRLWQGDDLGQGVYIGPRCKISGRIRIGDQTTIVGSTLIDGDVQIGTNVIIAENCTILSVNHDFNLCNALPYGTDYIVRKVVIEDNVWIGMHVCIAPGAHIGEGAIIGMGSVVTGEIPACSIAAGNPARVIKFRDLDRYKRVISEGKYLNKIRRDAPHRSRDIKVNNPLFLNAIREKGFMLNVEIKTENPDWQSAILYELAIKAKIPFGNAERCHIAVRPDLLQTPEKTAQKIARVISEITSPNDVNDQIICSDLEELAVSVSNPERRMSRY